jgi:uncharacterized protein YcbK (DUF882 family)
MSFSTRTMRAEDWELCPHFKPEEFKAPEKMGFEFMMWLEQVRVRAGVAMNVSSSWRSKDYNKQVGGAEDSAHVDEPCDAADLRKSPTPADPFWNHSRFAIVAAALTLGCVRIGFYANGSLHLDRSEDKRPGHTLWNAVDNPA